jgi:Zn-dependent peptidase ImmA (M78 family)
VYPGLRLYNGSMAKTVVSSARIMSMFANRRKDVVQAAQELNLSTDLAAITSGDTELDFADIQAIAAYFKKPWSYLLIDEAEVFPNKGQDNRTHLNQQVPVSSDLIDTLQAANFLLDAATELFPEDTVQKPGVSLTTSTAPSSVATNIRTFLGVKIDAQLTAKDEYEALRLWAEAIQARGVYVLQRRLKDDTIRAFSLTRNKHAIMVVDTGDTPYARIFSMLHEYCHILLKNAGICDLDEHSSTERYCNEFAAQVLLPDILLKQQLDGFKFTGNLDEDEEAIRNLSRLFRVSQAAVMIRLNGAGILKDDLYAKLETRRRSRNGRHAGSGGDYYRTKINSVGKRYAQNVFGALSEGTINRADASVLLGVGEHLVDRFKTELFHTSSGAQP